MKASQGAGKKRKLYTRSPRWNLEFSGAEDVKCRILAKLHAVKSKFFSKTATNTEILEKLLDSVQQNGINKSITTLPSKLSSDIISHDATTTSKNIIFTTEATLENLLAIGATHKSCSGVISLAHSGVMRGFVNCFKINCTRKLCPQFAGQSCSVWSSCKNEEGEQALFTVNAVLRNAYHSSALLPNQFRSLMDPLGLQYLHSTIDYEITSYSAQLDKVIM